MAGPTGTHKKELKVAEAHLETRERSKYKATDDVNVEDVEGDVVAELTQQLTMFGQFIYNAQEKDTILIVENLGYGDIYVSDKHNPRVGNEDQRLIFKEQKAFKAGKLFMISASYPIVSVIEIK
ncbi:hypothetical protein NSQ38_19965 [Paenibacillus sp. FSL R7-0313]|uniref:hypothetical protein n=1 Tax=Paenibacillus sp. FSL R7-0313 TaxID=2954532 RepID=UPI0030D9E242